MRVVVVGATGNVGSSLVRALSEAPEVASVLVPETRRELLGLDLTELTYG